VVKTAAFTNNRRIAAGWIPSRDQNKDDGGERFGGNAIFRELTQEKDGTLNSGFPKEMIFETQAALSLSFKADVNSSLNEPNGFTINAANGVGAVHAEALPLNYRITMEIEPTTALEEYGLNLRSKERSDGGYRLNFSPNSQAVSLGNTMIRAVKGLDKNIKVDIIVKDDIIDVSIDNKRCIVNRTPEQKGPFLWFYAKHGTVKFKNVTVSPLKETE
jgi:beta-fructofuranosidase